MYNIAIIEDNLELRKALSAHFEKSQHLECVLVVESVEKFLKFHRDFLNIQLIILDVMLDGQSSIYQIPQILQREPDADIIMYTVMDDNVIIFQALTYGATGYATKDIPLEDLEEKILLTLEGKGALLSPSVARKIIQHFKPSQRAVAVAESLEQLSPKESTVMDMLRESRTYDEIAERLGISVNGVRYHVKNVYRKLQVNSKGELFRLFKD